jgi:hypothetical protein
MVVERRNYNLAIPFPLKSFGTDTSGKKNIKSRRREKQVFPVGTNHVGAIKGRRNESAPYKQ